MKNHHDLFCIFVQYMYHKDSSKGIQVMDRHEILAEPIKGK